MGLSRVYTSLPRHFEPVFRSTPCPEDVSGRAMLGMRAQEQFEELCANKGGPLCILKACLKQI